jgi:hypothetical protein
MLRLTSILFSAGGALAMSLVGLAVAANAEATIDLIWVDTGQSRISEADIFSNITLRVILTAGPNGSESTSSNETHSPSVLLRFSTASDGQ